MTQLEERWQELVAAVKQEMTERGQDTSVLVEDFADREIKLPRSGYGERCTLEVSRQDVMSGDLTYLAHAFYEHYRAGCPETEETKEK